MSRNRKRNTVHQMHLHHAYVDQRESFPKGSNIDCINTWNATYVVVI